MKKANYDILRIKQHTPTVNNKLIINGCLHDIHVHVISPTAMENTDLLMNNRTWGI